MSVWENPTEHAQSFVCLDDEFENRPVRFSVESCGSVEVPDKWDYVVPMLAPMLVKAQPRPAPAPAPAVVEKPKAGKK